MTTTLMFKMPALPYNPEALEPSISRNTVDFHYGQHLQTYVNNLNTLTKGTEFESSPVEKIVVEAPVGAILNNAGQVLNHTLYFLQFKPYPVGTEQQTQPRPLTQAYRDSIRDSGTLSTLLNVPSEKFMDLIEENYGDYFGFTKTMEDASVKLFGSGWVWLAIDKDGKPSIVSCANGDNPIRQGLIPILGIDVWEHAYYLDTQNRRADHIVGLWDIIDWDIIDQRLDYINN